MLAQIGPTPAPPAALPQGCTGRRAPFGADLTPRSLQEEARRRKDADKAAKKAAKVAERAPAAEAAPLPSSEPPGPPPGPLPGPPPSNLPPGPPPEAVAGGDGSGAGLLQPGGTAILHCHWLPLVAFA